MYIDSYGFKHEKKNENDRLQYICVKLSHFYDTKARSTDENLWKSLLKTYENSSIVPVNIQEEKELFRLPNKYFKKTLKYLVRQGISHNLRSEFWHVFIHKKIQNIRKEKGAAYFENLCHLLPNSDVRKF